MNKAIAFEEQRARRGGDAPGPSSSPATSSSSFGLLTAAVVYGLALGGLFALVFAFVYGRIGRRARRERLSGWLPGRSSTCSWSRS